MLRRYGGDREEPGRIIEAWQKFVATHQTAAARRGIGEPIWAGRSPAELVECQHHESLLNLAFADAPAFWLLCPYDAASLPPDVIETALASHPFVLDGDGHRENARHRACAPGVLADSLPEPPADSATLSFDLGTLHGLRQFVEERAQQFGLSAANTTEIVLAVNEVATNSVVHGGGRGRAFAWADGASLLFEIRDRGHVDEPLVGRFRPEVGQEGGYGVWLANLLCDLVQIRSNGNGTVVRLHVSPR